MPSCAADAVLYKGACYFVSSEKATFDDAVSECATRGGSLLSLTDAEQSTFIQRILENSFRLTSSKYWLIGKECSQNDSWHRLIVSGSYK